MNQLLEITEKAIPIVIIICFAALALSLVFLLFRVVKGPTNPDRAVGLDTIGINLMALSALMSIFLVTTKLNDVTLLLGILSFIGTTAIAKYLEKGVIIDRDVD